METLADWFGEMCPAVDVRYFDTDVTYRYV